MLEGNTKKQHMNLSLCPLQQKYETSVMVVPIYHRRRADSIHTEMLIASTLFYPAPHMTRTAEKTQTPKARLLCGPVRVVSLPCAVLCCSAVVRWCILTGLCVLDVSRVPIPERKSIPFTHKI